MKLILTHEVSGLGAAGDIVTVKDGYGRNYLLPRGLATPWTKGGAKEVEQLRAGREARAIKDLDQAKGVKGQLEATPLNLIAQSTKSGRLFGSITQADVAEAAKAQRGISIDKRKVEFATPVKSVGMHTATVSLHPEVKATVKLNVKA
ncbi:50S ribosomal protein L9 [Dermatophilus congolensis]|uniref:Large ribosomal subunit protein bL9 n=1 Tax=Dermatophilus congolensis TaxID=1863 RepID=A0A239VAH7_9MICO|nr:50S ribosomal protein L9 [Dermatophilus congolensis]MBO3141695.1 50S ribosomal protein L9 [Dermatophilus congolensis]MBO3143903.1 50S ribosomal protein L9 [Dermatophilus congolensis]MBO3148398.1 50S ribosomal protein L9 [Dermatophilus congolensis]MBO3152894.1 50S ribosomal protein L9 [Dermatophilus congolensis]MBO3153259.1 50S ribosomal protein L9 [Dermatophilus congolensis]